MKIINKIVLTFLTVSVLSLSFSAFGCSEKKYSLSVTGSQLLYENLAGSYKAGEEVKVKVKITPHENTVAYLDLLPLTRTKSTQDDYFVFTFTMPDKSAVLSIENIKGFSEDLLTGFHLTFAKDGASLEQLNKDFKSPEAVANYYYSYFDESFGNDVFTSNSGADVFADGVTREWMDSAYGLKEFELTDTLYFTHELAGAVAYVDWVYWNSQTGEMRTSGSAGYTLNEDGCMSTFNTQSLSETRYSSNGEEYEMTFNSDVKINFEYIDYLTGVKVLEYDKDNQLLKTSEFTGKNRSETFNVGEACEYAVIEEEYTVMADGERKGEKRFERTLINKTTIGEGKTLKYPRGDGLIAPVYLSIKWTEN